MPGHGGGSAAGGAQLVGTSRDAIVAAAQPDAVRGGVALFDFADGRLYLVMEYVEGQDLSEILGKAPLGVPFGASLFDASSACCSRRWSR